MGKIISAILFASLFCITCGASSFAAASAGVAAVTSPTGTNTGSSFNILKMNTMTPANFKYPNSYANATTHLNNVNSYGMPVPPIVTDHCGSVNVYMGMPVYVMRSGAVYIDGKRNRKARKKGYYEDSYYEYYGY